MRRFSFSCLLLAVPVLSSCWVSNIGGKIRAQSELSVAVDTARPLHGEVFLSPLPCGTRRMLAPEVCYKGRYGLVYDNLVHNTYMLTPEVEETGRYLWVEDSGVGGHYTLSEPPPPGWQRKKLSVTRKSTANRLNPYETRDCGNEMAMILLAAPFDYAIDPLLTVAYNSFFCCADLLLLPFRAVQTAQPVMPEQVPPLYQPEPGE